MAICALVPHNKTTDVLRAQSAQTIFDVCNVHYAAFLDVCCELIRVILARSQTAEEVRAWMADSEKPRLLKKGEAKNWKEAQRRWIQYKTSVRVSASSFVHSWVTHTLFLPD